MTQSLVRGALLGGTVAFVWSMISWIVIPWHNATFLTFRDAPRAV